MYTVSISNKKIHLALPFNFGNNKDILMTFCKEITKTTLNVK